MLVAGVYAVSQDPSVLIAGGLHTIGKDLLVFPLMEPAAFRIRGALLYFLRTAGGTTFGITIIFVLQRLLSMRLTVCTDLYLQLLFIEPCFLLCDAFPHLSIIGPRLHVGRIYEYFGGIYQFVFIAFKKDVFEDLLEKVGIFKTAGIVLSESGEVGDRIPHLKSQEPPIGDIHLDLLNGLPHAPYSIEILDERDLDQHDRVHTRPAEIRRIFILHKVIDESPVDRFVDQAQEMVFWNQVVHTEELDLFPFLICILSHHNEDTVLVFDTPILPSEVAVRSMICIIQQNPGRLTLDFVYSLPFTS